MPTILVVDDAAFMRLRCSKALNAGGFDTLEAANGRQAIQTYHAAKPDAVLMDIDMPEMSGLDALRTIMAIDPAARVLMLTAQGQHRVVMDALKAGARGYIIKPYQPDKILQAVQQMLSGQSA